MSWCTYFSAEQIAEALVWDCCCEFPNAWAHSLPCVLHADLLSEENTVVWRTGMGAPGSRWEEGSLSAPVLLPVHRAQLLPQPCWFSCTAVASFSWVKSRHSAHCVRWPHRNQCEKQEIPQEITSHLSIQSIKGETFLRGYLRPQIQATVFALSCSCIKRLSPP